ncbi:MAG: sel1 repeat family protein [Synergistaceae bacterium]|jgi:hypothetical protein|nr:sel1 repeat family protein [Synergistaceae bacterium]
MKKNVPRSRVLPLFRGSSLFAMKILFHALVMFVLVFRSIPEADAEKTAALGLIESPDSISPYEEWREPAPGFGEAKRAASFGGAMPKYMLGLMYENGDGTAPDLAEAARNHEAAAKMGLPIAQNRVGEMYRDGVGVKRNLIIASRWFESALKGGYPAAAASLAEVQSALASSPRDFNAEMEDWSARTGIDFSELAKIDIASLQASEEQLENSLLKLRDLHFIPPYSDSPKNEKKSECIALAVALALSFPQFHFFK